MSRTTKNDSGAAADQPREPQRVAPKNPPPPRNMVPLTLVGAVVIGSAAFYLGRSSAAPGTTPKPSVAAEEAGHTEGEEGEEGHGEEHGGRIKLDADAVKTAGIQVESARRVPLSIRLTVPGTVEVSPNRSAKITPPVPGRVVSLSASIGQRVEAGQALAVLDSVEVAEAHASLRRAEAAVPQAQAVLQTAQAVVGQARTTLQNAEKALRGQQQLASAGVFSQPSLQAAQAAVADAESELLQAQTEAQSHTTTLARAERLYREQLIAKAELEQAQAEQRQDATRVAQAEARLATARQTLEREQRLARGGLLSRQALQANEAEVRAARSELQRALREEQAARTGLNSARSAVSAANANLRATEGDGHTEGGGGRITVYAPLAGVVAERAVTLGEAVERSTTLFVVEDHQSVQVNANVPERDVARVRAGQRVELTVASYPNETFSGVVQSVGNRVDVKTRTLPVRVVVPNPQGRLKPDMFATVALATDKSVRVLAVAASAIGEDGDERFVFVAEEGGYERRDVQIGRTSGGTVEIRSGIQEGDTVVTAGVFVLKSEGAKAELKGHEH